MKNISKEKWEEIKGYDMGTLNTIIDTLVAQMRDCLANPNDYSEEQKEMLDDELKKWMNLLEEERKKIEEVKR